MHEKKKKRLDGAIDSFIEYKWKFPANKNELKEFVKAKMIEKVKIESNKTIRFCSNLQENLLLLAKHLSELYSIEAKVSNARFNGIGTKYFEFNINKKAEIEKLINQGLISEKQMQRFFELTA